MIAAVSTPPQARVLVVSTLRETVDWRMNTKETNVQDNRATTAIIAIEKSFEPKLNSPSRGRPNVASVHRLVRRALGRRTFPCRAGGACGERSCQSCSIMYRPTMVCRFTLSSTQYDLRHGRPKMSRIVFAATKWPSQAIRRVFLFGMTHASHSIYEQLLKRIGSRQIRKI